MSPATAIVLFFVFGMMFGLATHAHRHLFSEGHTKRSARDERDPLQSRFAWALLCSALWPLMALTGLFSWWAKAKRSR
jgi:Ca2+/H+ antiporter